MRKLTKEDILKGKNRRETLYIKEYDAEVVIRPLTDGELTELFSLIGNLPVKEDGTPDLSKIDVATNFEILRRAASMGLVEPKLTIEELADMFFGVPEFIGAKVLEISGVVSEEESKKK
ncbi:MAG: hypothetical protein QXV82_08075 [Ignisphaera sp.]